MGKDVNGYLVKAAAGKRYDKALNHRVFTSGAFMELQPLFYKELKPFDELKGNYQLWSRLNPMPVTCFGQADYHFNRFFVRYKDVWRSWDDFENKTVHNGNGYTWFPDETPYFLVKDMYNVLLDSGAITEVDSTEPYDFIYRMGDGNDVVLAYMRWVSVPVAKLLYGLGYRFSWIEVDNRHWSLMPLLCWCKVYVDHYFPKSYLANINLVDVCRMFAYDEPSVYMNFEDSSNVYYKGILSLFTNFMYAFYDNDGFYQAWDNPSGPNTSNSGGFEFLDTTISPNEKVLATSNSTPPFTPFLTNLQGNNLTKISQLGLKALGRISDMMKRFQISGSSFIERFLARYGQRISDTHTAFKLGQDYIPVQMGDVESNSDTQITLSGGTFTSLVGDLAGKGVAARTASLNYKNDSHAGMYLGILSIVPDGDLWQGYDRNNLHTQWADFCPPELDSLGVSAINRGEIYTSDSAVANLEQFTPNSPFGFLPFGYEYCLSRNILNGQFAISSLGSDTLGAYHLYRELGMSGYNPRDVVHGLDFMSGKDGSQYNRIFYNTKASEQFIVRFHAKYNVFGIKKSLSDSYDWDDSDGKEMKIDANSVTTN